MKLTARLALGVLLSSQLISFATTSGFVFCDSNQNGQFDSGDVPIPGVLIVVTNSSGTFSNANWTSNPEGGFSIALGSTTDTYVEYIHPATLPSDAVVLQPSGGVYTFTLGPNNTEFTGNFLVSSATCSNTPPPPPPPTTNYFCLHGSGSICGPQHSRIVFSGTVLPDCTTSNGASGQWEICARPARLRFQGVVLDIVGSGEAQDDSGATFRYIDFQGTGSLKGIEGCRANHSLVFFTAHAEDHGQCQTNRDSLYFHVYTSDGTTLLLISGDSGNADDVVPLPISLGDITIGTNCCPCSGGHQAGGDDEGDHNSGQGNGNCHQGNGNGQGEGHGNGNDHGEHGNNGNHGNGNGHGNGDHSGNCDNGHGGNGGGHNNNHSGNNDGNGNHGGNDCNNQGTHGKHG